MINKSNYLLEIEVNGNLSSEDVPVRLENVSRNAAVAEAIAIIKMEAQKYLLPDSVNVNVVNELNGTEVLIKL